MTYKAKVVKNRNNKYNIYVIDEKEEVPIVRYINFSLNNKTPLFNILAWETREDAVKYINSKDGELELIETDNKELIRALKLIKETCESVSDEGCDNTICPVYEVLGYCIQEEVPPSWNIEEGEKDE